MELWQSFLIILVMMFHLAGIFTALHAVRFAKTAQGALAWTFALILLPYVALILYWMFGPHKYRSYITALAAARNEYRKEVAEYRDGVRPYEVQLPEALRSSQQLLNALSPWDVLGGNELELLIDGEETFDAIFAAIRLAQKSILVQFYILRNDEIGQQLKALLIERAQAGVQVYVLLDSLGSLRLSQSYLTELRAHGVLVETFKATSGISGTFSMNFRNHRKIVLVDGSVAFVGGHNVGDEYLGRSKKFGHWRDTHLRITGPAVQVIQGSFIEDWNFVTGTCLPFHPLAVEEFSGESAVLPLATGPTSQLEDCSLMFMEAIAAAKERFWISSPYFVPDEPIVQALQRAALRGIDVRILLPAKPDHLIVWLAGLSYFDEMVDVGAKVYRYRDGFLHQKVFLVDDYWSMVGTANLDNRSLRLNFELSLLIFDHSFAKKVEAMLEEDFSRADEVTADEIDSLPLRVEVAASVARLFSPIL